MSDELARMKLERDLAIAQARDIGRQLNDQLEMNGRLLTRTAELERELERFQLPNNPTPESR